MKIKNRSALIAALAAFVLGGCASLDAVTGLSADDESTEGMSCEDLAKRASELSATQRRVEAVTRISGGDLSEVRVRYAEIRQKVTDAQIAAGCK